MSMQWMGFLATVFLGFTVLNRIAEGALIKAADVTVMRSLSLIAEQEIFGLFKVPILNPAFFTVGLKHLMNWDYSFFGGNAVMLQYLMSAITAAVAFGLFLAIASGMVQNFFSRR